MQETGEFPDLPTVRGDGSCTRCRVDPRITTVARTCLRTSGCRRRPTSAGDRIEDPLDLRMTRRVAATSSAPPTQRERREAALRVTQLPGRRRASSSRRTLAGRPFARRGAERMPAERRVDPVDRHPAAISRSMTSRRWWSAAITSARSAASGGATVEPAALRRRRRPPPRCRRPGRPRRPARRRRGHAEHRGVRAGRCRRGRHRRHRWRVASMSAPASIRTRATSASP